MKGYDLIECDKGLTYCCSKCCFKCRAPAQPSVSDYNDGHPQDVVPCLSPVDGGVSGYFKEVTV